MDMLGKDCLLQLVLEHFQEDIAKSVNFVTGEVGVAYSDLLHNLVFLYEFIACGENLSH